MEEWNRLLEDSLNEGLYQMTAGGPRKNGQGSGKSGAGPGKSGAGPGKSGACRLKVRPVLIRGQLLFQFERFSGNQVFHKNLTAQEAAAELEGVMQEFRQLDVQTASFCATVLSSKKGKITVSRKKKAPQRSAGETPAADMGKMQLAHNRAKKYILEEGRPVPFLQDLGVQTAEGKIVKSRYDKFRQINRFLEFIEDVLPELPGDRCVRILDFGCGKSYLTFAMYYYLHELKGLELKVTGLDLKADVISHCSALAEKYGYSGLEFLQGDIAEYGGGDSVDMVVTLHACDTATDYALAKAVAWNAGVILSVPCCQHEVNRQIQCEALKPALKYGLIRERMSALLTDAIRANLLEEAGYDTQVLEFIDMEHTPKNILLRAVKKRGPGQKETGAGKMADFLHVHTCLQRLMEQENS